MQKMFHARSMAPQRARRAQALQCCCAFTRSGADAGVRHSASASPSDVLLHTISIFRYREMVFHREFFSVVLMPFMRPAACARHGCSFAPPRATPRLLSPEQQPPITAYAPSAAELPGARRNAYAPLERAGVPMKRHARRCSERIAAAVFSSSASFISASGR